MYRLFFVASLFIFNALFIASARGENIYFANRSGQDVKYQILHPNPSISTSGFVADKKENKHSGLTGFGPRAVVVWDGRDRFLFAGGASELRRGYNLILTLERAESGEYYISAALGKR